MWRGGGAARLLTAEIIANKGTPLGVIDRLRGGRPPSPRWCASRRGHVYVCKKTLSLLPLKPNPPTSAWMVIDGLPAASPPSPSATPLICFIVEANLLICITNKRVRVSLIRAICQGFQIAANTPPTLSQSGVREGIARPVRLFNPALHRQCILCTLYLI